MEKQRQRQRGSTARGGAKKRKRKIKNWGEEKRGKNKTRKRKAGDNTPRVGVADRSSKVERKIAKPPHKALVPAKTRASHTKPRENLKNKSQKIKPHEIPS